MGSSGITQLGFQVQRTSRKRNFYSHLLRSERNSCKITPSVAQDNGLELVRGSYSDGHLYCLIHADRHISASNIDLLSNQTYLQLAHGMTTASRNTSSDFHQVLARHSFESIA